MKSDQKNNINYCPYLVNEENIKERFDEHGNRGASSTTKSM